MIYKYDVHMNGISLAYECNAINICTQIASQNKLVNLPVVYQKNKCSSSSLLVELCLLLVNELSSLSLSSSFK